MHLWDTHREPLEENDHHQCHNVSLNDMEAQNAFSVLSTTTAFMEIKMLVMGEQMMCKGYADG